MNQRVYVMECDGFVKIGVSGNVERRAKQIPYKVRRIYASEFLSNPFDIEREMHRHVKLIKEWLDYGELRGFSQWRNSGKGRYVWDELDKNGNIIGGNNVHKKVKKTGTKGSKKA